MSYSGGVMTIEEINSVPAFNYDSFPKNDEELKAVMDRAIKSMRVQVPKAFLPIGITLYNKQKEFFDALEKGNFDTNLWKEELC